MNISRKEFIAKNDDSRRLNYVEYKPETNEKLPLIIEIHGAGNLRNFESLADENGGAFGAVKQGHDISAIIVKPHSGAVTWFEVFETLLEFVDTMAQRADVDKSRVYCIGASMGGYTTWQLGMSRPDLFAAIVPICGGGMYWNAAKLKSTPVWAFHGARDRSVFVEETLKMVRAVNDLGGDAKVTVYPHAEHDAWTPAFNSAEMWEWLFSQKKDKGDE